MLLKHFVAKSRIKIIDYFNSPVALFEFSTNLFLR